MGPGRQRKLGIYREIPTSGSNIERLAKHSGLYGVRIRLYGPNEDPGYCDARSDPFRPWRPRPALGRAAPPLARAAAAGGPRHTGRDRISRNIETRSGGGG